MRSSASRNGWVGAGSGNLRAVHENGIPTVPPRKGENAACNGLHTPVGTEQAAGFRMRGQAQSYQTDTNVAGHTTKLLKITQRSLLMNSGRSSRAKTRHDERIHCCDRYCVQNRKLKTKSLRLATPRTRYETSLAMSALCKSHARGGKKEI
mmetsp:Transcript_24553/g.45906  ORF Transcript_24553/g.45906 Transcript_24553/m.45906 type:complete len:151 (+) Transcript_24553:608-1060(+)